MMTKGILPLLKTTYTEWSSHNAPRLGASVAFYSILSFAPLLVLTVAVIALVFGTSNAQATLVGEARQLMGDHGAATVDSLLKHAQKPSSGIFSGIIAFATLLFGASGVFAELREALDIMWEAKRKAASGFVALVKDRLFSFGIVLSVGFLLLVSLLLSAALAFLGHAFSEILPMPPFILQAINFAVSFVVVAALFALMFKYIPAAKTAWRDVIVGALGTALLFTIGKFLLGIYIGKGSVGSTYGAAGSLVAVVVWIYYSAQIFFFGAEFTHIYSESHLPAPDPKIAPNAAPAPDKAPEAERPQLRTMAAAATAGGPYLPTKPELAAPSPAPGPAVPRTIQNSPSIPDSLPVRAPLVRPATKPKLLMAVGLGFILGRFLTPPDRSTAGKTQI